ncbi:MAG: anti-sigma regulatory factor [Candidatus Nanopelagicales bacterium]
MTSDRVELRIPASSAYLSLARATTAGICARLDFPLDRLDDLALAVDEAVSLLLLDARPGTDLECAWEPDGSTVRILITSQSTSGRAPRTTSFAWTVLTALVDEASAEFADGRVTLELRADAHPVAVS